MKTKDNIFYINDNKEIHKLNKLFYYNSDKYIFFNNNYDKKRIDILLNDKNRLMEDDNTIFKSSDNQYMLRLPNRCIKKNFNLEFIKIKKYTSKIKVDSNKSAPLRAIAKKLDSEDINVPEDVLRKIEGKVFKVQNKDEI